MLSAARSIEQQLVEDVFAGVTTVGDRSTAEQAKATILEHTQKLIATKQKLDTGDWLLANRVRPMSGYIEKNTAAEAKLNSFLGADARRDIAQQHLQPHAMREKRDHERLLAQMKVLIESRPSVVKADATKSPMQSLGQWVVDASAGRPNAGGGLAADFGNATKMDSQLDSDVSNTTRALRSAVGKIGPTEKLLLAAQKTALADLATLESVIAGKSANAEQAKVAAALHAAGAAKSTAKTVLDGLAAAAAVGSAPAGFAKVAGAVVNVLKFIDDITPSRYEGDPKDGKAMAEYYTLRTSVDAMRGAQGKAEASGEAFDAQAELSGTPEPALVSEDRTPRGTQEDGREGRSKNRTPWCIHGYRSGARRGRCLRGRGGRNDRDRCDGEGCAEPSKHRRVWYQRSG
jgi:hypothetical protein